MLMLQQVYNGCVEVHWVTDLKWKLFDTLIRIRYILHNVVSMQCLIIQHSDSNMMKINLWSTHTIVDHKPKFEYDLTFKSNTIVLAWI